MNKPTIVWHRCKKDAITPTKRAEDAGFDLYTVEKDIILNPHETRLFSTGLNVAISEGWWLLVKDRGSTGSKGIHVHCGVVDSGYRGELFVCLHNTNSYPVKFTNDEEPGLYTHQENFIVTPEPDAFGAVHAVCQTKTVEITDYMVYPTSKGIAQIIPIPAPEVDSYEATDSAWENYFAHNSERGEGKLGASGK